MYITANCLVSYPKLIIFFPKLKQKHFFVCFLKGTFIIIILIIIKISQIPEE